MRSDAIKKGFEHAPHRSLLRATGVIKSEKDFDKPQFVYELIVQIGFANSKSEARKLIRGNGVRLNQSLVKDEHYALSLSDLFNKMAVISVGKKKHFKVKITQ